MNGPTAPAGSSAAPAVPKAAKAKAAKGKAKAKSGNPRQGKPGVLEVSWTKASDIKEALPRYNRTETKKRLNAEIMQKVMLAHSVVGHASFRFLSKRVESFCKRVLLS